MRKGIRELLRERYFARVNAVLLEMEVTASGGRLLLDAGLEVTDEKTGEKFTVQSVQNNGGETTVCLVSPENVTGPITSQGAATVVSPGKQPHTISLKDFEKRFRV